MADGIEIKIDGAQELTQLLKNLDRSTGRRLIRSAFKQVGALLVAEAKKRVPVDSGQLRDSLQIKISFRKGMISCSLSTGGKSLHEGDQFYGAFIELGTSRLPPQPFLRPSLKDNETAIKNMIIEELRQSIAEAMR